MTTHYFECKVEPSESNPEFVLSRTFQTIHDYLGAGKETGIGISFPDMTETHPGLTIRIYGDQKKLSGLHKDMGLQRLYQSGGIDISEIQVTPSTDTWEVYTRARTDEKSTALYAYKDELRFVKHLAKKGIEIDETKLKARRKRILARQNKQQPFFQLTSASTGQAFMMYINKKDFAGPGEKVFNAYGLSTHENLSGVPVF